MRKFVDDEIIPHVDEWEKANGIPRHVFKRVRTATSTLFTYSGDCAVTVP